MGGSGGGRGRGAGAGAKRPAPSAASSGSGTAAAAAAAAPPAKKKRDMTVQELANKKINENMKECTPHETDILQNPVDGLSMRARLEADIAARQGGGTQCSTDTKIQKKHPPAHTPHHPSKKTLQLHCPNGARNITTR